MEATIKIISTVSIASSSNSGYKILLMKETLKIKQNVDLLEEKIRKYFAYWLDICSSEVERQKIIYCSEDIYGI